MKKIPLLLALFLTLATLGQEVIALPYDTPENLVWQNGEKTYYSNIWETEVVTNVSRPTMQVFRPSENQNTGVAVIIAPGGGLYALSINSEGNQVAEWLNEKGITAFVLRYRLFPTGDDGVQEITALGNTNPEKIGENVIPLLPYAFQDGLNAIQYVRENAGDYGINPDKIGFMGFSAGGAVTMGVTYEYTEVNRPNFVVPVYPWTSVYPPRSPKIDAPPLLVICATNDPLDLATGSVALYTEWLKAKKSTALHMYSKGGHGFGMRKNGLPTDTWIERFYDWSIAEGIVTSKTK
ncbi:MAG: alpha/beta hydrolase [Bacteroidota bacterium]